MAIGLAKFCDLKPQNVKLFDQVPHNVCVCMYPENMHLILHQLSKYINLAATFQESVAQLTYNNLIKECFYCQYEDCKDSLYFFCSTTRCCTYSNKVLTMAGY